jgi:hypothetical protein
MNKIQRFSLGLETKTILEEELARTVLELLELCRIVDAPRRMGRDQELLAL